MKKAAVALAALCAPCAAAAGAAASAQAGRQASGVHKVIQMLADMTAKAKEEKHAEEVAFAKFETWCSQETRNLEKDAAEASKEIELLTASIGKLGSDIKLLGDGIAKHQSEKASHDADAKAQKAQRDKDHAAYLEESQDFSASVSAIERAMAAVAKQQYDRPGAAAALLQVSSSAELPDRARSVVSALLDMMGGGADSNFEDDDDETSSPLGGTGYAAPKADAYQSQTGGITELLKKLQDDFRSKLSDCQKEEMNSKHASDMILADLIDSSENAQKASDEKTEEKERKAAQRAKDEKQLGGTRRVLAESQKMLEEVSGECSEKSLSYQEKQKLRGEEIEAINKAIEILESPDVTGNAEKHLALAQASRGTVLAQAERALRGLSGRGRVRDFLAAEGRRLQNKQLSLLAEQLRANPFAKVKKMIDSMITRLLEEAKQDAEHEGFCDTEMGKNKVTRDKLSEDIDALSASIETGKATILELAEGTAQLEKEIADLQAGMDEATNLRMEEKAKNEETVKDAKAAQAAVAAATAVLKDFYEKASAATAFVQDSAGAPSASQWGLKGAIKMGSQEWNALANPDFEGSRDTGHKEGMQTFGETEQGQQDSAQYGVLGLLEVIQSDFASLEADTTASEAEAAEAYERFTVECKRNVATKQQKVELNSADKTAAEAKLQEDTADLKSTQDGLLAADRYHKELVPQCVDQGMTWEERVAARQAEIDSLKEALTILESDDVA